MRKISCFIAMLLVIALAMTGCAAKNNSGSTATSSSTATPSNAATPANTAAPAKTAAPASTTAPASAAASASASAKAVQGTSDTAVLKVGLDGEPQSLLTFTAGPLGGPVDECMYDKLIFFNSVTNKYEPMLAKSWETINDTTIRYHLRNDAYTINGTQITAKDVLYTFREGLKQPLTKTIYSFYDIEHFVIPDDFTIDIVTFKPYCNALLYLAENRIDIHSEKDATAAGGIDKLTQKPTDTSGGYVFKSWKPGEKIVLERNEKYWGQKGYYKTIEFYFLQDANSRAMALQSGDIDVINTITATQGDVMKSDKNLNVFFAPCANLLTLSFNCSKNTVNNVLLRQAVSCAIDKSAILKVYCNGHGSTVDTLLPNANPLYADIDKSYKYGYDPNRAKELLAKAGFKDGFSFKLLMESGKEKVAQVIQNNLAQVGIKMELDIREFASFSDGMVKGDYDSILLSWFPGNNIQPFYQMDGRVAPASKGVCYVDSTKWNDTLDKLYGTADFEAGRVLSKQLTEIFAQNMPAVSLISPDYVYAGKSNLTNFYLNPLFGAIEVQYLRPVG